MLQFTLLKLSLPPVTLLLHFQGAKKGNGSGNCHWLEAQTIFPLTASVLQSYQEYKSMKACCSHERDLTHKAGITLLSYKMSVHIVTKLSARSWGN